MLTLLNSRGNLKYFEIQIIPLRIYENFKEGLLTLKKNKLSDSSSTGLNDV